MRKWSIKGAGAYLVGAIGVAALLAACSASEDDPEDASPPPSGGSGESRTPGRGDGAPPPGGTDEPRSPRWPNEPAGLAPVADHAWKEGSLPSNDPSDRPGGWWRFDPADNLSIISSPDAPNASGEALQIRFPKGLQGASSPGIVGFGTETPGGAMRAGGSPLGELFVGFHLKLSEGFERAYSRHLDLLSFHQWGEGERRNRTALFVVGDEGAPWRLLMYNELAAGLGDSGIYEGGTDGANVEHDRWHKVELYMKRSSARGEPDGVLRVWVDGASVVDVTDARTADEAITEFYVSPLWGASRLTKAREDFLWLDGFYLSGR